MIFRRTHNEKFTTIDNAAIQNAVLSWKATGLLCFLLSLPNNWKAKTEHLATVKSDGITSVRGAMEELEEAGYIRRHYVKTFDGTNLSEHGKDKGRSIHVCDITEIPNVFNDSDLRKPDSTYEVFCDVEDLRRRKPETIKDLKILKSTKKEKKKDKVTPSDLPDPSNPFYAKHKDIAIAAYEQNAQTPTMDSVRRLMAVIDECAIEWPVEQQAELLPLVIARLHDRGTSISNLPGFLKFKGDVPNHPYGEMLTDERAGGKADDIIEDEDRQTHEQAMAVAEFLQTEQGKRVKAATDHLFKIPTDKERSKVDLAEIKEVEETDADFLKADDARERIKGQLAQLEGKETTGVLHDDKGV